MPNPYDDIVGADQTYDSAVANDAAQANKEALRSSVLAASNTNPDQYAKAKQLSRTTGIPAPVVDRNMPDVQRREALTRYDRLLDTSPGLAQQMSDSEFAKVAHDDTSSLGHIETVFNSVRRGVVGLMENIPSVRLRSSAANVGAIDHLDSLIANGTTPADISEADDPLHLRFTTPAQRASIRNEMASAIPHYAIDVAAAEQTKQDYPSADVVRRVAAASKDGWRATVNEFASDPLGFLESIGPESLIQNAPGMVAGFGLGRVGASLATRAVSAGAGSFATDYASSIQQGLQDAGIDSTDPLAVQRAVRDPVLIAKIGREAFAHAFVVGSLDGASGHLSGSLPVPKKIAVALAKTPVVREVAGAVAQVPVQGALGAVGEAGGELAAGQKLDPFQIFSEFVGEAVGAPGEVLTLGGHEVAQRVKEGRAASQAEKTAVDLANVQKAAADSKLRTRDPEAFKRFVESASTDGPVSDVYINAKTLENTLAQSGVTPEQFRTTLPEASAQLTEAIATEGDVRIPIEDFAAHVAGTPLAEALLQHLRTDPEAMSLADARSFHQEDHQAAQAEVARAEAQASAATAPAAPSVREDILGQLTAANRFTPAVNEHYADLFSAFYDTSAQRAGLSPETFAAQYPVRVVAEQMGLLPTLNQNTESPAPPDAGTEPGGPAAAPEETKGPSAPGGVASGALSAPSGRGFFDPSTKTIGLLKNADLSTFIHEAGHAFLDVYSHVAERVDAPAPVKADVQAILDWFGVKDLPTWMSMSLEEQRPFHEQFARGFEAYAFEGESPSLELSSVFGRFRAWLLQVYRHLTALHVELTPEVRAVMARMLATDAQIKTAQLARQHRPLFESAEAGGMSREDFARYQSLGTDATGAAVAALDRRSLRDMQWLSNAKDRKLKALQRDAKSKRDAVRAEVAAEVMAEPENVARTFLKTGETTSPEGEQIKVTAGHKLNSSALTAMYPESSLGRPDLDKLRGLTGKDGVDPETAAQMFGFSSADHLVRSLIDGEPAHDKIEGLTDQRLLERYGDITSREALERAAEASIHNDVRAKFLEREVNQLSAAVGSKPILLRAAREYADQALASKKIRDIKPTVYSVAETRAGREAENAFKKGDTRAAAAAKRAQLLNHELVRGAQRAQIEIEKATGYLKKFDSPTVRGAIDASYRDQIDALLERYDLRASVTNKDLGRRKSLRAWVESQRELGFEPIIDDRLLDDAARTHLRDATLEEVRGLVDAVKNIEHLGRLKNRLLTEKSDREFGAVVESIAASIKSNARKTIAPKLESNSTKDRVIEAANDFMAAHRKAASLVREMDGFQDGGVMWEALVRTMNEAGDREAVGREQATIALGEIVKALPTRNKLKDKVYIPEIATSLSREGRISVALNWGNEDNRQRVRGGDNWSAAQVQAIISTLSTDELRFVQRVWDHLQTYWPAIAAKERRLTGVAPQQVEAAPFTAISAEGTAVEMTGGYYPIKYDPNRSSRAEADTLAESIKSAMQGLYTRATTRRGHTKARVDEVAGRPLRKDLGVVFEHVEQVVHDLSWHEYLIDANRLIRAPAIDGAIRDHYGVAVLRQLRNHLEAIAAGDVPATSGFEKSVNYLRAGATVSGLGWNLVTSLLQPLGLTQSIVRIGPQWVGKGLARWIGDAATMENTAAMISSKSDFMRLRAKTQQREIAEIRNRVSGDGPVKEAITGSFFYAITKLQLVADIPTWLGQYEKSLQAGSDEASSIAQADQAVIDAQGGGQIKDLAGIQRGGPLLKLWTNFYSFFNVLHNLSAESFNRTRYSDPRSVGILATDLLLLFVVPSALSTLLKGAIKGDLDDPDKLSKQLIADQLSYMLGTMLGVREFSSAAGAFLGLPGGYSGPAGARVIGAGVDFAKQAGQGDADAAFWHSANTLGGVLFHYPAVQVQRTVEGTIALMEGKSSNPAVLLFGPPKDERP